MDKTTFSQKGCNNSDFYLFLSINNHLLIFLELVHILEYLVSFKNQVMTSFSTSLFILEVPFYVKYDNMATPLGTLELNLNICIFLLVYLSYCLYHHLFFQHSLYLCCLIFFITFILICWIEYVIILFFFVFTHFTKLTKALDLSLTLFKIKQGDLGVKYNLRSLMLTWTSLRSNSPHVRGIMELIPYLYCIRLSGRVTPLVVQTIWEPKNYLGIDQLRQTLHE